MNFEAPFGVIAPRHPDDTGSEPWFSQTECLVRWNAETLVYVRAHFQTTEGGQPVKRSAALIPVDVSREVTRHVSLGVDGIHAQLVLEVEPGAISRLRVRLENHESWRQEFSDRAAMLVKSLVSGHVLLRVEDGEFVS